MAISTGNLVRSRNPGNAQSIIQSFLNSYLTPNDPNIGLNFYSGNYPTGSISDSTAKAAADALYAGSGFFNDYNNRVTAGLTESAIANVAGQIISANNGVSYTYPASSAQGIPSGSFTGFSQIFVGEMRRYLIYRNISATTTVTGNIPPAGDYTSSGKALINPNYSGGGGISVSNGGKINPSNIVNPSTNINLVPGRVISAGVASGPAPVLPWVQSGALDAIWNQFLANYGISNTNPYAVGTFSFTTQFTIPTTGNWTVYVSGDEYISVTLTETVGMTSMSYTGPGYFSSPPMNITPTPVPLASGTIVNVSASYTNTGGPGAVAIGVIDLTQNIIAWTTLTYLTSGSGGGGGGGGGNSDGIIGGTATTAFNTYWAALIANWLTAFNNAGTVNISGSVCHGSCHSSCHGSRGRR